MKTLLSVVAFLVVLLVVGFLAWSIGATRALDSAIKEADTRFHLDSFATDYAERDTSTPAAWQLEAVAGRIGVHVVPSKERELGEAPGAEGWESAKTEISKWVADVRRGSDDMPEAPPEVVASFLERHAGDLDELESLLLSAGEIRFASKLDQGPESPLPNLIGSLSLTRLLAARAMAAKVAGDEEAAWRSLEAAWRLERTLDDQPALITRLIAIAELKVIAAAARRLDPPAPAWLAELESTDVMAGLLEGIRGELYFQSTIMRRVEEASLKDVERSDDIDSLPPSISKPLFQWDAAFAIRKTAVLADRARETDPCVYDPAAAEAETVPRPWWAKGFDVMTPQIASTYTRANQTALAIEGTRAVLDLKANPDAFTRRPSSVCEGESWITSRQGDGSTLVRFTGTIIPGTNQPEQSLVPTEHVIPAR